MNAPEKNKKKPSGCLERERRRPPPARNAFGELYGMARAITGLILSFISERKELSHDLTLLRAQTKDHHEPRETGYRRSIH